MLWDLIFDFYIKYIFGGLSSDGTIYSGSLGFNWNEGSNDYTAIYTNNGFRFQFLTTQNGSNMYMPLGNYMSLIATIITLVIILLVIGHFIKKLFNLFGRII